MLFDNVPFHDLINLDAYWRQQIKNLYSGFVAKMTTNLNHSSFWDTFTIVVRRREHKGDHWRLVTWQHAKLRYVM